MKLFLKTAVVTGLLGAQLCSAIDIELTPALRRAIQEAITAAGDVAQDQLQKAQDKQDAINKADLAQKAQALAQNSSHKKVADCATHRFFVALEKYQERRECPEKTARLVAAIQKLAVVAFTGSDVQPNTPKILRTVNLGAPTIYPLP